MRADRLLSLLLLLQNRGKMTARQLAEELEVSERTIYRDINALSYAGVPVYGSAGPEGGYDLVENYRTRLTGLSDGEIQALFMLSIPAPLNALGMAQTLKSAMLKLTAALPESRRPDEEKIRQRILLDPSLDHTTDEPNRLLHAIHEAVWNSYELQITYKPFFTEAIQVTVYPFGLVARGGKWYLVCEKNEQTRVHRVDQLLAVKHDGQNFVRPDDFDLVAFWENWRAEQDASQSVYQVRLRIQSEILPYVGGNFGEQIRKKAVLEDHPDPDGFFTLDLAFESLFHARMKLLPLGGAVEVLTPLALRLSMQDVGVQIAARYTD